MKWYELVKIVHFLGLVALVGAFMIYPRAGEKLRKATTLGDARTWLGFMEVTKGMVHGGATMLIVSGLTMAWMRWRSAYAFIAVGLIVIVMVWIGYTLIASRHMRAIRAALGTGDGPVPADVSTVIRDPRPWTAIIALNLSTMGVLFEMTLKLRVVGAIALVVGFGILGFIIGSAVMRSERTA